MSLYDKNGWLNFKYILGFDATFVIMVGARQVGKTYGCLKYCIEQNRTPLLLRRTQEEVDIISKEANDPFRSLNNDLGTDYHIVKEGKISSINTVVGYDEKGRPIYEWHGMCTSLKGISKYRGFDGSAITDVIYDEFIPEQHVVRIRGEGDAVANMYVTVAGNREIKGKPPLKLWMLANSNNIYNPVLSTFGVVDVLHKMQVEGQEVKFLPDRGILLLNIMKSPISDLRKKSALFKAIGNDSDFAMMANNNSFAYNDMSHVYGKMMNKKDLASYVHIGKIYVYFSKSRPDFLYVTHSKYCEFSENYDGKGDSQKTFRFYYSDLQLQDSLGNVYYESVEDKQLLFSYLGLESRLT